MVMQYGQIFCKKFYFYLPNTSSNLPLLHKMGYKMNDKMLIKMSTTICVECHLIFKN